jgi:hypothetical protein
VELDNAAATPPLQEVGNAVLPPAPSRRASAAARRAAYVLSHGGDSSSTSSDSRGNTPPASPRLSASDSISAAPCCELANESASAHRADQDLPLGHPGCGIRVDRGVTMTIASLGPGKIYSAVHESARSPGIPGGRPAQTKRLQQKVPLYNICDMCRRSPVSTSLPSPGHQQN